MTFQRGLEPKAAMNIGMPRCEECHKVLKEYETKICMKCKNKDDIHFMKRREVWASPLFPIIAISAGLYYIFFAIFWVIKWFFYSAIRPFSYSPKICEQGFHKYRFQSKGYNGKEYKCKICGKHKYISTD